MEKPDGDVQPAFHPVGKGASSLIGPVRQGYDFKDESRPIFKGLSPQPVEPSEKRKIFPGCQA